MTKFVKGFGCLSLGGMLALAVLPATGESGVGSSIQLAITGTPETLFTAECVVTTAGEEEVLALHGQTPQDYQIAGEKITCAIMQTSAAGHLQVEIRKDGNISRSRTNGKNSTIRLSLR